MSAQIAPVFRKTAFEYENFRTAGSIHFDRSPRGPVFDSHFFVLVLVPRRNLDTGPGAVGNGSDFVDIGMNEAAVIGLKLPQFNENSTPGP